MTKQELISKYGTRVTEALEKLANVVSDLPEELIAPTLDLYAKVNGASGQVRESLKAQVKAMVTSKGRQFTEAGSKVFDLAGWRMEVRPTGGGVDYAKLEILLRAKGVKKKDWNDEEVVYHPNKEKIQQLIGAGKLKQKELDSCLKEGGFSVQSPTKLEESESNE